MILKPTYTESIRFINGFYYFQNTIYFLWFSIKWKSKAIKCIKAYTKSDKIQITYKNYYFKKPITKLCQ